MPGACRGSSARDGGEDGLRFACWCRERQDGTGGEDRVVFMSCHGGFKCQVVVRQWVSL